MSTPVALMALIAGIVFVIGGADVLVDAPLGLRHKLGLAPFVLTVALSGFETENLAAGIATNAKGGRRPFGELCEISPLNHVWRRGALLIAARRDGSAPSWAQVRW